MTVISAVLGVSYLTHVPQARTDNDGTTDGRQHDGRQSRGLLKCNSRCCSGWVWESFPTNKVSVAILSRLGDLGLRLTGLFVQFGITFPHLGAGVTV